ncbi:bifunctional diaminohydroxyphosphoribosylaminopyrimidine deaminase/5-amino-6-(5-phosphoribosylamino)uracil reductase RibD [bacterium endosymbiont of Pedicinus badii]|uniref:bifunctional diaminohydroxyphosphoribosylaminopyrimidine deaminase/5-amino-6-(5-phosphoribosylamino)uracil reductase RibD n=1 Tax=bacterium endosymbiont of Pedicinus badii TaxID=1719126 RepID=UPI0009BC5CCD|nr:bifunctional diaminohydroxyphosphoribosylaminopyrimidine deaminase/5-amino-6-(5-phosphoribosylamino)uracil reductase RibD [bacterium endosymbiont of Pedicinus badii]OQM34284.1 5-amino-6-(5-phosphoribosylamino)uracil reductase [bacterium endosymbiont of Pedicinus badii]
MEKDKFYLSKAFQIAKKGRFTTSPNPNVGCIIVRNCKIVGKGYHKKYGGPHAEISAIKKAGKYSIGSTIYVTLEPCIHYGKTPPCVKEIIKAKITKIVIAMIDPNPKVSGKGIKTLKESGIEVKVLNMIKESEEINFGFLKRMRTGIPWIRLKLAISIDGKIAMNSGESKWITCEKSRRDVQEFRAESDAILSTSNTIIKDDPNLTVRWNSLSSRVKKIYSKNMFRNPIRIILDSKNRIDKNKKIFEKNSEIWIIKTNKDKKKWPYFVKQIVIPTEKVDKNEEYKFDLLFLMKYLGKKRINNVLVESGSIFSSALLKKNLLDEIILYQSPKFFGKYAIPMFNLPKIKKLEDAILFSYKSIKRIGKDIRIIMKKI